MSFNRHNSFVHSIAPPQAAVAAGPAPSSNATITIDVDCAGVAGENPQCVIVAAFDPVPPATSPVEYGIYKDDGSAGRSAADVVLAPNTAFLVDYAGQCTDLLRGWHSIVKYTGADGSTVTGKAAVTAGCAF